ncbi:transposase [Amycolatopsis jejuensis]|uniref:transposase n=1 Tax=Amycolatopsis jejuensis TaxID=330084 RepID=UPI001FDFB7C2|nr:transposase [Amycolatopsis jejuensis]
MTNRRLLDGVPWRVSVGSPWRDVSSDYGCWQTFHGVFRRWQRASVDPAGSRAGGQGR